MSGERNAKAGRGMMRAVVSGDESGQGDEWRKGRVGEEQWEEGEKEKCGMMDVNEMKWND